jgi:hypothetical protein
VLGTVVPTVSATAQGMKNLKNGEFSANTMQRVARINGFDQQKFEEMAGEPVGEYLVKRGIYGNENEIVGQLATRFQQSKATADEALEQLGGTWKAGVLDDTIDELYKREVRVSTNNVPSRDMGEVLRLKTKYESGGLTMSEINRVKRLYEKNVRLGYLKENNSEAVARATNIDDTLREWQFATAEKLGLKNLREINKETQLARELGYALFKKNARSAGNNAFGLTDAILLSGGDPNAIAMLLTKKTLGSNNVRSKIAKLFAPGASVDMPTAQTRAPITQDGRLLPEGRGSNPIPMGAAPDAPAYDPQAVRLNNETIAEQSRNNTLKLPAPRSSAQGRPIPVLPPSTTNKTYIGSGVAGQTAVSPSSRTKQSLPQSLLGQSKESLPSTILPTAGQSTVGGGNLPIGKELDTIEQFIDYTEGVTKLKGQELIDLKGDAQAIADRLGIGSVSSDKALAKKLRELIDKMNNK